MVPSAFEEIKQLVGEVNKEIEKLNKRYTKAGGTRLRKALLKLCKERPQLSKQLVAQEKEIKRK